MSKMSEDQNTKKEQHMINGGNEEQTENSDGGNESLIIERNRSNHPSNDLSVDLNEEIPPYAADEIEVQTSDIIMIEELPSELSNEDSVYEKIETLLSYEFPADSEEENFIHLPRVHFEEMQNLDAHDKSETPIFEINTMEDFKYINPSPDELADIEDNVKSSSSENESAGESKEQEPLKGLFCNMKPKQDIKYDSPDKSKILKKSSSTSSCDTGDKSIDTSCQPSCSYITENSPKLIQETFNAQDAVETKKNFKISMSTIEETPELEVKKAFASSDLLQPMSNRLKMKPTVVKRKDKCNVCNARLGLCAIKCRCGGYFCAKHRYDNEHNCTFDYKKMGAEEIRKNNPKIVAEKVRKL